MKVGKVFLKIFVFVCGITMLFTSCAGRGVSKRSNKLRIAIQPTRAALPLWVAREKGYFTEEGLDVELVMFQSSAAEKDAAFHAGLLDGMTSDLVASALLKARGEPVRIVSLLTGKGVGEGRVAIVASPKSSINDLESLRGKELGVSRCTIMEFAAEKMLKDAGLSPQDIHKVSIPKIHLRLNMLLEGRVQSAVLPEPLVTFAQMQGGRVILDDHRKCRAYCVLTMREEALENKKEATKRMLKAINRATREINEDPWSFRSMLINLTKVPKECREIIRVTRYAYWKVPDESMMEEVVEWLLEKELIKERIDYKFLVNETFVTKGPP